MQQVTSIISVGGITIYLEEDDRGRRYVMRADQSLQPVTPVIMHALAAALEVHQRTSRGH